MIRFRSDWLPSLVAMSGGFRVPARFLAPACVLALACPSVVGAQSIVRGELVGRVLSQSGIPLAEAVVGATNERSGLTRFGTTVRDGSFQVSGLTPGEFTLRFEALGFRPLVYTGVSIRPGQRLDLEVSLEPSTPPVESFAALPLNEGGGVRMTDHGDRWFGLAEIASTPDLFPGLAEISALSSGWDTYGGAQGLPGSLSRVYVDGLSFTPAIHPYRAGDPLVLIGLPRRGLGQVGLLQAASDVEWSGGPGGYTSVNTRTATAEASLSGYGATQGTWDSDAFEGSLPDGTSYWGDASANFSLGSDSSRIFLAAEALSMKTPRWRELDEAFMSTVADELNGTDDVLDPRWNEELEVFSGLARLDWTLESGTEVMVRANLARTEERGSPVFGAPVGYGHPSPSRATDLSSLFSVSAPFGDLLTLEVRAGFERSNREYGVEATDALGSVVPATHLIVDRVLLGGAQGSDGRVLRTSFLGGPILHVDLEPHQFKGGIDISIPSYEYAFAPPLDGFYFSDGEDLRARQGAYVGTEGGEASTSFTVPRLAGFVQYRWTPVSELAMTTGIRWDHEFLPTDRIAFNETWWDLTGLSNVNVPSSVGSWGGRVGITWDLAGRGSTLISGAVGAHSGGIDPALLHEVILLDGPVGVRQALGSLGSWPQAPDEAVTGSASTVLAVVDPDIRPPLTTRASLSLARNVGIGTTVRFSGTYRRTEYLARRADLNRVLLPVAETNLDRPIYGTLAKAGSVVQAFPGTNRRFEGFGPVWALNSDGRSEYLAASVAMEFSWGSLKGFADYTLSSTEDNWVGAAAGLPDARLGPALFSAGSVVGAVWEEGVSDFDLPHRLVAGFDIPLWERVTFGATLRLQSGYPFTPSYPAGSDVNADGSSLNDPSFVPDDPAVLELAGEWGCLDAWIGRVVERNACRAPMVSMLDLRLHLTLAEWSRGSVELLLEGFNLTDARTGPRDGALLLVDPDRPITGQGTASVEIPTVVNPNFGELLFPTGSGRRARIGIRLGAP